MSHFKLTREQHRAIMDRRFPKIAGKGTCPLEHGQVVELTTRVAIRVDRIRVPKGGGWSISYTRIDNRDLYLMPTGHRTDLDDDGRPKPMSEAEEHGMNTNPRDPVGAGPVALFGAEYQTVVKMPSRVRKAERPMSKAEADAQVRSFKEQLRSTAAELDPAARAALFASLERTLAEVQRREEAA